MKLQSYLILLFFAALLSACSATQKAEKSLDSGDYNKAFNISYTELSKDKSNEKMVSSFKEAYDKSRDRDLAQIEMLKTQKNPESLKKIYALYEQIDIRQYQAITLQPLYINGKEVSFDIYDYTDEIAQSKRNYSEYLYTTANQKMKGGKLEAREAYKLYNDLEYVNPSYVSDLSDLINKAKTKGSSLVVMSLDNKIATLTTKEDVEELMKITESNMNDPWVIYHTTRQAKVKYDHEILVTLSKFNVTPQQVNSETIPQQATIQDGWEYVYDSKGNVMKDDKGNDIKRAKVITVQAELKLFQQLKTGQIEGSVTIKNLQATSTTTSNPIVGEAKFENVYGLYRGDQRAIEQKYYEVLQKKEVPFPTDAEFVKYGLYDFKSKMLQVINQLKL